MYLIADIGNSRIKLGCFLDSYNPIVILHHIILKMRLFLFLLRLKKINV